MQPDVIDTTGKLFMSKRIVCTLLTTYVYPYPRIPTKPATDDCFGGVKV